MAPFLLFRANSLQTENNAVKLISIYFENDSNVMLNNVSFFLSLLDLSIFCKRKEYAKYPLEAVLKLHLYKRVKGLGNNYESLKTYFKNKVTKPII